MYLRFARSAVAPGLATRALRGRWLLLLGVLPILFAGCGPRQSTKKTADARSAAAASAAVPATGPATTLPAAGVREFTYTQLHMGVATTLQVYAPSEEVARDACAAAFKRIAQLEDVASDYRRDSELMRLCAKAGGEPVPVSDDLFLMLDRARQVSEISGGAFDVTVGPYVLLWRQARRTGRFPDPRALEAARRLVGYEKVVLDPINRTVRLTTPGMKLDLGGIAKGYAGDAALAVLRAHGLTSAAYQAGGDIVLGDPPPGRHGWIVDVVNERRGRPSQKIFLSNCAISTSGDTYQWVEIDGRRYSHIVDPRTGIGLERTYLATIIAPDGLTSDPLSKVASVLGRPALGPIGRHFPKAKVRFAYGEVE